MTLFEVETKRTMSAQEAQEVAERIAGVLEEYNLQGEVTSDEHSVKVLAEGEI